HCVSIVCIPRRCPSGRFSDLAVRLLFSSATTGLAKRRGKRFSSARQCGELRTPRDPLIGSAIPLFLFCDGELMELPDASPSVWTPDLPGGLCDVLWCSFGEKLLYWKRGEISLKLADC